MSLVINVAQQRMLACLYFLIVDLCDSAPLICQMVQCHPVKCYQWMGPATRNIHSRHFAHHSPNFHTGGGAKAAKFGLDFWFL